MNTTETNKKLAEFLGWKEQTDPTERWFGSFRTEEGVVHRNTNKEPMLFHNDWNWIMLVVDKIESFTQLRRYYRVDFFKCEDSDSDYNAGIYELTNEGRNFVVGCDNFYKSKIEAVYNACSMFVDWYNNQKP